MQDWRNYMPAARSSRTEGVYRNRAAFILHRYYRETGLQWEDGPMEFAQWVTEQQALWKKSTWRISRLAVTEFLLLAGAPHEAIDLIRSEPNPPSIAPGVFLTRRVRGLPDDDLNALVDLLGNPAVRRRHRIRKGQYDRLLACFLRANVLVGLRPSEWEDADLREDPDSPSGQSLLVQNRKNTNGRGNGDCRLLHLSPAAVEPVQRLLEERKGFYLGCCEWANLQMGMMKRLQEVRGLVTQKSYTLYSTRHRFVSAAKKEGVPPKDMADMMGHGSIKTVRKHYGKRRARTTGRGTAPDQSGSRNGESGTGVIRALGIRREADTMPYHNWPVSVLAPAILEKKRMEP